MRRLHSEAAALTSLASSIGLRGLAAHRRRGIDPAIAAALFAGTLAYLAAWPRDFYVYDEGLFLYEGKRVLEGQVLYRDFFEIFTPASLYLMAGTYALFGVSLETARAAMAVVHGLIGATIFAICRQLGVRRGLSVAVALLHLTLGYPAMTIATPHWMSSALDLVLLLMVLRGPVITTRRALVCGALTGVLILVQQQRGIVMSVGIAVVVASDGYAMGGWRFVRQRCAGFATGVGAVVVPIMVGFCFAAGFANVVRALILHPIRRYPRLEAGRGGWGFFIPQMHPWGFIISNLPLLLPAALAAALWQWWQGLAWCRRRPLAVTLIFALSGLLSVAYNPNYVHFVQVAPLWFAVVALMLEHGLRRLQMPAVTTATAAALSILILLECGQLAVTLHSRRSWLPFHAQTAFGRVDFASSEAAAYIHWLTEFFHRNAAHEIFAFASIPGFYLMTGTDNPTRFQIMVPYYTERDQLEEIVAALESKQVPYIVRSVFPASNGMEPLHSYVQRHYESVITPFGPRPTTLYRRRPDSKNARPQS